MIEIGCNYSPELMELIEEKKVKLDWIKLSKEHQYRNQFQAVNGIKPVLLHFVPGVVTTSFAKDWDQNSINIAIEECGSPHVALHCRAIDSDFESYDTALGIMPIVLERLQNKKKRLPREVLIENMPITCLSHKYKCLADPKCIKHICEEGRAGLCLDTAHAQISAHYRNETIDEYINELPLDHIKEIHVSSPRHVNGDFKDMHEVLLESDYKILNRLLKMCDPKIVTLEYGGEGQDYHGRSEKDKIEEQLKNINEMIGVRRCL